MTEIIGAPTLDDALAVLGEKVALAEARGQRNLIFCEDRLTLLAERAVVAATGGTFSSEVTTFARFLSGEGRVLSKQGSVMAVSAVIAEEEERLVCFGKRAAQAVYETLAQLAASRVSAEQLRAGAEETEGLLKSKLLDLALLSERYRAFLSERGYLDESGYLALLPAAIERRGLSETNVFFFAFPSFTRQARESVSAAIRCAANVTGIFLAGREDAYTNEGARLFRRAAEECGAVEARMASCSLEGDALALRDALSYPERAAGRGGARERAEHVTAFSAADEWAEAEAVAALVKRHVSKGLRYRDMAVLLPDGESYLALEKAFYAAKIPFYADRKRPFSEHPFAGFVLDVLEGAADGVLPEEADAVAGSVFFGESGEYRNYLLKYGGFRGGYRREIKEGEAVRAWRRETLVSCRERMLALFGCIPKRGTGEAFTSGVRRLRELTGADDVLARLGEALTGAEREFLSLEPLEKTLAEIALVAGGRVFTAREFADLLRSGLEAQEISLIPQSMDAVFVGDMTESRFLRVKALFCTGMTNAVPRVSADTAVITDGEIGRLASLSVEIEPAIAQVNRRARESLILNLCSFSRELYLSCPVRRGGEETVRSDLMRDAERMFELKAPPPLFPFSCSEKESALLALLEQRERFENGAEQAGERFSSLLAVLRSHGEGERAEALLSGGKKEDVPEAGSLYFRDAVSPTLLESYFDCPYAGFAARGLRLREREERTVLDTDAGTFVHAVLERAAKHFNEFPDEAACRAFAAQTGAELIESPRFAALSDTRAGAYTGKRLIEEGIAVSAAAYRQLALSAFRVRETEGTIELPELSLAGKTDRIDEAGDFVRIIDYKTGSIDDKPTSYYTGRRLQLQLYLLGASRGRRAAGAFYFPAADEFSVKDEPRFRMKGFWCGDDEVVTLLDTTLQGGGKSTLFEGGRGGREIDRAMSEAEFSDFLEYARLVSEQAEREMREGNIAPSPYDTACRYCKFKGLCGFAGTPRKRAAVKCGAIVELVRRAREEGKA